MLPHGHARDPYSQLAGHCHEEVKVRMFPEEEPIESFEEVTHRGRIGGAEDPALGDCGLFLEQRVHDDEPAVDGQMLGDRPVQGPEPRGARSRRSARDATADPAGARRLCGWMGSSVREGRVEQAPRPKTGCPPPSAEPSGLPPSGLVPRDAGPAIIEKSRGQVKQEGGERGVEMRLRRRGLFAAGDAGLAWDPAQAIVLDFADPLQEPTGCSLGFRSGGTGLLVVRTGFDVACHGRSGSQSQVGITACDVNLEFGEHSSTARFGRRIGPVGWGPIPASNPGSDRSSALIHCAGGRPPPKGAATDVGVYRPPYCLGHEFCNRFGQHGRNLRGSEDDARLANRVGFAVVAPHLRGLRMPLPWQEWLE